MSIYTKDMPNLQDPLNEIGEFSYGNLTVSRAYGGCKLKIGKYCSFGNGIQIMFLGKHTMEDITRYPFAHLHSQNWPPVTCSPVSGEDIIIGNDIWIGNAVIIHQGTIIGDGAVVGAHSVVKTKVEPYCLYAGNPAKKIRPLFPDDKIKKLMEMQWWNWDINLIKKHLQLISSPNVNELYQVYLNEIM